MQTEKMGAGNTTNDTLTEESAEKVVENKVMNSLDEEKQLSVDNETDDREEGEIVDDYDFIISSDEEFCMRQRIEELEAKNEELEQIAKISSSLGAKYASSGHYDQKHAIDRWSSVNYIRKHHSEVADDVYTIPSQHSKLRKLKKRRHKGSKVINDQVPVQRKKRIVEQEQKFVSHHQKQSYKKIKCISDCTKTNSMKSELLRTSGITSIRENENTLNSLSRGELRLTISRPCSSKQIAKNLRKHSQMERNNKDCEPFSEQDYIDSSTRKTVSIQTIVVDDDSSSNDSESLEEQELRLIALKSAVMKKHLARKKRDAEVAYSPTDFEDRLGKSAFAQADGIDVADVEMEEWEDATKDIMEVSPIASPTLQFNSMDSDNNRSTEAQSNQVGENTKLVDMDIVDSDSSEEITMHAVESEILKPLENFQHPSHQLDKFKSYSKENLCSQFAQIPASQFVTLSFQANIPELGGKDSSCPHIPKMHSSINGDSQISHLDDKISSFKNARKKIVPSACNENENILLPYASEEIPKDEDEEESLRALLLSRLSSSKPSFKTDNITNLSPPIPPKFNASHEDDPDTLRSLLLTSMVKKKSQENPSESILKEAVRRIKMKTNSDNVVNMEKEDNSNSNLSTNSPSHSTFFHSETYFKDNYTNYQTDSMRSTEKHAEWLNIARTEPTPLTDSCQSYASQEAAETNNEGALANSSETAAVCEQINTTNKPTVVVRSVEQINEIYTLESEKELEAGFGKAVCNINKKTTERNKATNKLKTEKTKAKEQDISRPDTREILSKQTPIPNFSKAFNTTLNSVVHKSGVPHAMNTVHLEEKSTGSLKKNNTDSVKKVKPQIGKSHTNEKPSTPSCNAINKKSNSSVSSVLCSERVIKANKIINAQSAIKAKEDLGLPKAVPNKSTLALKADSPTPLPRHITNAEIPKVQVKKLVITLQTSDTETSDDDYHDAFTSKKRPAMKQLQAQQQSLPLKQNFSDHSKKSPPSSELKLSATDCFEKKLDVFLRNARSRVQSVSQSTTTPTSKSTPGTLKKFSTPVAVRHLPYASQQEYCRLVHRMELLEKRNKKQSSTLVLRSSESVEPPLGRAQKSASSIKCSEQNTPPSSNKSVECQMNAAELNNAENLAKSTIAENVDSKPACKSMALKARESLIRKTGVCIMTSLDKSLQLVEEAKRVKRAKLCYEQRLRELRVEMEEVRTKVRQEQQKMSKTFTKINESNKVVTTLKERYKKLTKCQANTGNVKAGEYRLNNDLKQDILKKSKILAAEIKAVNAMQSSDCDKILKNKTAQILNESRPSSSQHSGEGSKNTLQQNEIISSAKEISTKTKTPSKQTPLLETLGLSKPPQTMVNEVIPNEREELLPKAEQASQTTDGNDGIHRENVKGNETGENRLIGENDEIHKKESTSPSAAENSRNHVSEYISPLVPLKMGERPLNPNGIICPYDLMGQCEDKDCHYDHLTAKTA